MNESSVLLFIGLDEFETGSVDVLMIFFMPAFEAAGVRKIPSDLCSLRGFVVDDDLVVLFFLLFLLLQI